MIIVGVIVVIIVSLISVIVHQASRLLVFFLLFVFECECLFLFSLIIVGVIVP